ncbi:hypothetical protein DFR49_0856 [Hephaestia caeni]|uniref:General secretion pathway protein L n=1 Tax=Hephaestia caeni TaxID=645617 RepID=A0A397PGL6_9SPHN|nr:PilN domain-containing protein [Hephaestia caeni]RIA46317.1 hypothetical protein DFR49_0856 [Hephaestia caeni]
MSAKGILDADMATIGRWLSQGMRWWVGELEQLLPTRLRFAGSDGLPRLSFVGDGLLPETDSNGRIGKPPLRPGARVAILVPSDLCLARVIERPVLGERDLQRMAAFEGDSVLPFPPGTMVVAARRIGSGSEPSKVRVEVAGLPIDTARAIADAALEAKVVPTRIALDDNAVSARPIDFAPAMREAGLLPRLRSATPLVWAVVGSLVAINVGILVWRDVAAVERLEGVVEAQQPAVTVAQTITRRIDQDRALVAGSLARRREHDALAGLAAVSKALPEGAWLQRYVWDGPSLKLTGYKPPRTDVAGSLRRSGGFAEVRSMNDDIQAEVPAGEPFDVGAKIVRR